MILALCALVPALAGAETLSTDLAAPAVDTARPTRGASMSAVEARFGAPARRHDAVGKPPITRWDYPGFSVFFEYSHVIHAVAAHPLPPSG
ncbi:MAG: hypothetical protein IT483_02225 [Gammaproteobacteria bacterium]|nr:hypothetical protein [Gammaproteobacteria bacterium]